MSGQKGRSGRRARRPAAVLAMPMRSPTWQPAAEDLEGLGAAGRRFLTQLLTENDCSVVDGVLLILAAHCEDALAIWRTSATVDKAAARLVLGFTKTQAALLAQVQAQA